MNSTNEVIQVRKTASFVKGNVINELMNLVDTLKKENNANYKILLFTNAGALLGDIEPCASEGELIKYTDDPAEFTLDTSSIFNKLKKGYTDEEESYAGAYMINVKNASLYANSKETIINVEQIIIFADQITGFSLVRK